MKATAAIARRVGIGVLAIGATLLTGACAAGQVAATAQEKSVIDGTMGQVGSMGLHAVAIVAPSAPCVLPGADAALTFIVVNTGPDSDSLQGVSSPRFASSAAVATADDLSSYAKADPGSGSCSQGSGAVPSASPAAPSATSTLPAPAGPQTVSPGRLLQLGVYNAGTNPPGVPDRAHRRAAQAAGRPAVPGRVGAGHVHLRLRGQHHLAGPGAAVGRAEQRRRAVGDQPGDRARRLSPPAEPAG